MLWLQTPDWGRRVLTFTIVAIALFVEFRPNSTTEHPFLTEDVPAGVVIDGSNTEMRKVPAGLLVPVGLPVIAQVPVAKGEPVLAGSAGTESASIPPGWWTIETEIPAGTPVGAKARLLIGDGGQWVEGIVAAPVEESDFGAETGAVAVRPEHASLVASAASSDTLIVMIETG